jgi:hypothetical protein
MLVLNDQASVFDCAFMHGSILRRTKFLYSMQIIKGWIARSGIPSAKLNISVKSME